MLPPYCYPEQISSSHLTDDILEAVSNAGILVEMDAPTPCRGIDKETKNKYRHIRTEERFGGAVKINRFPLYAEGKNVAARALRYVLCNLLQISKGAAAKDVDLLYSASTPPTQGLMIGSVKKRLSRRYGREVPFLYNLQDVFPDSMVAAGLTSKGSLLWRIGRKIENKTYSYADKIIVISEDIKENIKAKGVPEEKIVVIPNWIDTDAVRPVRRDENKLFDELGIDRDKFIVVYAGNLGMAQGIDTLIDAAKDLPEVEFLVFGEGSCKEEYMQRSKGCEHIHFLPLMPRERVPEVYSMGDLCLVACKKGLGGGAVPSKTFSIMATATPVLLSFDEGSQLWRLIESNQCGFCAAAGDSKALVAAIETAKRHPEELARMGKNARACVERDYSKSAGTSRVLSAIKDAIG